MKNWKKFTALFAAALALCLFASCSNSAGGGGSNAPQETTPPSTPAPAATYTITFNANDGSENPATATQTFKAGVPQALTSVEELGFTKSGYYFIGWGDAYHAAAHHPTCSDRASYTANASVTLYAIWTEIPDWYVYIIENQHGSVTATPNHGPEGTEITLSNTPNEGYQFAYYSSEFGQRVTVTDGKFTMPFNHVYVEAVFSAINYNIQIKAAENGSVTSNATATVGKGVELIVKPDPGYMLSSFVVTDEDGEVVISRSYYYLMNGGYLFSMPAKNVTVTPVFSAIKYKINGGTFPKGTIEATPETAGVGTTVTLTANPVAGYALSTLTVIDTDGVSIAVSGTGNTRTFTMPPKSVTVAPVFSAINYNVNVGSFAKGTIKATPETAGVGTTVTLTANPVAGYGLSTLTVIDEDGASVSLSGTGNTRTFTMPAKSVTVTAATFSAVNYSVNVGPFENGSVTATPSTATVGSSVTLTVIPASGYRLSKLAVVDDDGVSVSLNGGRTTTFTMPAKNVTVTATFSVLPPAVSGDYTKTGTYTINGTQYDLATFGLWPQTIKYEYVTVNESDTVSRGDFTYCRGSDGQWYVKQDENARLMGLKYSDGTKAKCSDSDSYKWFKVEPIKWRVLTTNYKGKKLLLAENILINKMYANSSNTYLNSELRVWLNSDSSDSEFSNHGDSKGFLKTAFTDSQIASIASVSVDNSERSTNPDTNAMEWNNGANQYACHSTSDKIFLLSVQEATKSDYGFAAYNASGADNERIRQMTDFAIACGSSDIWWLRSPLDSDFDQVRFVKSDGSADGCGWKINIGFLGVVPALCLEN